MQSGCLMLVQDIPLDKMSLSRLVLSTTIGTGNYVFNETVSVGDVTARVKVWDASSNTLDINMLSAMEFPVGGKIVGQESGCNVHHQVCQL